MKLEFRLLLINFGKSILSFIIIFGVSAYLLLNHWKLWPVFLIFLLWTGVLDTAMKILKLPNNESIKIWGNTKDFGIKRVILKFFSFFIHCVFITLFTNLGIKLYILLKPEISTMLGNQIPPVDQRIVLIFLFVAVLLLVTLALAISVYGDLKKIKPNGKHAILIFTFTGLEVVFIMLNLYIALILHVIAIVICLILATKWVERLIESEQ